LVRSGVRRMQLDTLRLMLIKVGGCIEHHDPQDEPGGRIVQASALLSDRRAPSTVARGDEPPTNSHESREDFPQRHAHASGGPFEARSVIDRRGSRRRGDSVWTGL
jgi:hypothetical protein